MNPFIISHLPTFSQAVPALSHEQTRFMRKKEIAKRANQRYLDKKAREEKRERDKAERREKLNARVSVAKDARQQKIDDSRRKDKDQLKKTIEETVEKVLDETESSGKSYTDELQSKLSVAIGLHRVNCDPRIQHITSKIEALIQRLEQVKPVLIETNCRRGEDPDVYSMNYGLTQAMNKTLDEINTIFTYR
jgi:hypothetical protein